MDNVSPRSPNRPLLWPEAVLNLQQVLAGITTPVYIVGGAVRDALLHRPVKDVDLTTTGSGIVLARQIANRMRGDFFPLDNERDVGRALVDTPEGRLMIDVARFRRGTLLADLTDRDFTINAMAVDLHGDLNLLIDPLGGEADASSKLIRRCAPDAISNDPIRALRAVRQSVQLGMRIEPDTLADLRANGTRVLETSPERVRDEFMRLLALPKPAAALRVLDAVGLLTVVIPEVVPLHGLALKPPQMFDAWGHTLAVIEYLHEILVSISPARTDDTAAQFSLGTLVMQLDRYRAQLQVHTSVVWPDERPHRALLVLAALLHDTGSAEIAENRANALRLSNHERQRLANVIQHHTRFHQIPDLSRRSVHRFWRTVGDAGVDVCLLGLADFLGTAGAQVHQDAWLVYVERVRVLLEAYYEKYEQLIDPPMLLNGKQLMEQLGLKPGPLVGELLDLIREGQASDEIHTVDDALAAARLHLGQDHRLK